MSKTKLKLHDKREYYKPFSYQWAYDAWLASEQSHWLHTEVALNEDIKDWQNKLSESEKYFLTQIFRFFTQGDCFSSDTEILTQNGWKYFYNLTEIDRVAQYTIDGHIEFVTPINIIAKPYSGEMLRIKADRVNVNHLVTPNHNIVYRYKNELKKEKAKDIKLYHRKYIHVGGKSLGENNILTPLERIFIAFQADGSVGNNVNGDILGFIPHRFTFKKQRKIDRMRKLLIDANLDFDETTFDTKINGRYTTFYVHYSTKMDKNFDWVDLEKINYEWCIEFCNEIALWDGHVDKWNRTQYYNTNEKAANKVHAIACLGNLGGTIKRKIDNRSNKFSDIFIVTINKKGYVDTQYVKIIKENYNGNVYCVTVPSGMILVRANGKSFISGNCDVSEGYVEKYLPIFPQPEVRMMLMSFAAREAIHIAAYSHLIETIGMPESTYKEFYEYKEMVDKHDFVSTIKDEVKEKNTALQIATFSAFTEGVQLFSSFVMLLNFQRHGLMKGMGQIIVWSISDEAVTPDTEVLLSNGNWITIDSLTKQDRILEYDMNTQECSFVFPEKIQKVQRNTTYEYIGDNFEQHVSPNHRMIYEQNSIVKESKGKDLELTEDNANFISSGKKLGIISKMNEKQKELCIMSAKNEISLEWVKDLYDSISSEWCEEFLTLYKLHQE